MDPNEIFEYVTEGMKWLAIGGGTYLSAMGGLSAIERLFSERINSQEDLDRIAGEEAKKLGMNKPFNAKFHSSFAGSAPKLEDGTYEINIGGFAARRSLVRHELYHIHRGHSDALKDRQNDFINTLDFLFRCEPQAIAYQVFRLKL